MAVCSVKVSDFDFELPDERIALRPANPRDAARMLVVAGEKLADSSFVELQSWLRSGDVLVFNDTRVISGRLRGTRAGDGVRGEAAIEATLHLRKAPDTWRAFVRPGKRLKAGDEIRFSETLIAEVLTKGEAGEVTLCFNRSGRALDSELEVSGVMPLPPYIAGKRKPDERDRADYQTVYAQEPGAVAAPTAGLHFTEDLLGALDAAQIKRVMVTLHVGAGTFLPVKVDDTDDHKMHAEFGVITDAAALAINDARTSGGRIVAVGTTSLRLLESASGEDGTVSSFAGETDIFIAPGYRFRATDGLLTNFHLPRSTLFMLVSAFSGAETMKWAYAHAIERDYRFYSYGDVCLLMP